MGGAFDTTNFLHGYSDQDVYFNEPMQYIPNVHDWAQLAQYSRGTYVLGTGEWDICRGFNETMAHVLHAKGIPCKLDVWGHHSKHDWPYWQAMIQNYL